MSHGKRKLSLPKRLPFLQPPAREPAPALPRFMAGEPAEQRLRDAIQKFGLSPRFGKEFERALAQYFGPQVARTRTIVANEGDMPDFQEWFFFDRPTASGETIIETFAREEGPKLGAQERRYLDLWRQWNHYRLLEVQQVMPGTGIVAVDLLSGESLEIHDRSASRSLSPWTLFLARPIYTDRLHFTGSGVALPPMKKEAVLKHAQSLLARFRQEHGDAPLAAFYRRHGLELRQFMRQKAEEKPQYVTPEGHPLAVCTAYYRVRDGNAVADILDAAEEFNLAGPSSDDRTALHYNWLLRGRSHVPEQPKPEEREALIYETYWIQPDEKAKFLNLGDVDLWEHRLKLSCMSKARLQAGKNLLESLLGDLISHQRDTVEKLDDFLARQPSPPPAERRSLSRPSREREAELIRMQIDEILNRPSAARGGKTLREAVKDPEGRAQAIEFLKGVEYIQDRNRREGKPWFDVNEIRRELGLLESE